MENPEPEGTPYDAVIVGGGHNGLVCAAYLAQAGHRVAVVERRDIIGGACVTDELFPGYRFSTASLATTLFRQEIIDDLGLAKRGLKIIPRDQSVTALFADGRSLALGAGDAANAAEIGKFSVRDARMYPEYARRGFDRPGPHHRGTLLIAPSMDHLDRIHAEARLGRPPDEPHVECTIPTGLYLCGAGTRPGGGVFGVPGKNASDVVRRHLENRHVNR